MPWKDCNGHQYDLTYRSCQVKDKYTWSHWMLADSIQDTLPGVSPKEIDYILDQGMSEPPKE